jgi:hypothetical protein
MCGWFSPEIVFASRLNLWLYTPSFDKCSDNTLIATSRPGRVSSHLFQEVTCLPLPGPSPLSRKAKCSSTAGSKRFGTNPAATPSPFPKI